MCVFRLDHTVECRVTHVESSNGVTYGFQKSSDSQGEPEPQYGRAGNPAFGGLDVLQIDDFYGGRNQNQGAPEEDVGGVGSVSRGVVQQAENERHRRRLFEPVVPLPAHDMGVVGFVGKLDHLSGAPDQRYC